MILVASNFESKTHPGFSGVLQQQKKIGDRDRDRDSDKLKTYTY